MRAELGSYKLHYGAYMNRTRLAEETDVLEMVLESEPGPGAETGCRSASRTISPRYRRLCANCAAVAAVDAWGPSVFSD